LGKEFTLTAASHGFQWLARQLERQFPGATNLQRGAQDAYEDWEP
jgi:hypothetical protein